jgi:hypothetical protein
VIVAKPGFWVPSEVNDAGIQIVSLSCTSRAVIDCPLFSHPYRSPALLQPLDDLTHDCAQLMSLAHLVRHAPSRQLYRVRIAMASFGMAGHTCTASPRSSDSLKLSVIVSPLTEHPYGRT